MNFLLENPIKILCKSINFIESQKCKKSIKVKKSQNFDTAKLLYDQVIILYLPNKINTAFGFYNHFAYSHILIISANYGFNDAPPTNKPSTDCIAKYYAAFDLFALPP